MRGKKLADHLIALIRDELRGNWIGLLAALANAEPSVRKRVLDAFKAPRGPGRPRKGISDEEWLKWLESWRETFVANNAPGAYASDLVVIEYGLKESETRFNRPAGIAFDPNSKEGRAEIRGLRDAVVRARQTRSRKN